MIPKLASRLNKNEFKPKFVTSSNFSSTVLNIDINMTRLNKSQKFLVYLVGF